MGYGRLGFWVRTITFLHLLCFFQFAHSEDWEKRHEELCKVDQKYCGNLKNSNGTFKEPKQAILEVIKELGPQINEIAERLQIDPRAIAGSILAENSLNVGLDDHLQNLIVKLKIAPKGKVLDKEFSFGFGQIYLSAALEAEPMLARSEKRAQYSHEVIAQKLLDPVESIKYVGAIIRVIQDNYKSSGIDISKKPGILATLYNLGQSKERAQATKNNHTEPQINYFGFFVEYNLDKIEKALSSNSQSNTKKIEAAKVTVNPANKSTPERAKKSFGLVTTQNLTLYYAPPRCQDGNGDQASVDYYKYLQYSATEPVGVIDKNQSLEVVSPGIGCDLTEWKLIKDKQGRYGWTSQSELDKVTRKSVIDVPECVLNKNSACIKEINGKKIAQTLDAASNGNYYQLHSNNGKKPNYKNVYFSSNGNNSMTTLSNEQIVELQKMLSDVKENYINKLNSYYKENKIESVQTVCDEKGTCKQKMIPKKILWSDSENLYQGIISGSLYSLFSFNPASSSPGKYIEFQSSRSFDEIKLYISKLEKNMKLNPSYSDLKEFNSMVSSNNNSAPYFIKLEKNEITDKRIEELRKKSKRILMDCIQLRGKYVNFKKELDVILRYILTCDIPDSGLFSNGLNNSYTTNFSALNSLCQSANESDESKKYICLFCDDRSSRNLPLQNTTEKLIKTVNNDKDYELFLLDALKNFDLNNSSSSNCLDQNNGRFTPIYDPQKTVDEISKILEHSCVTSVQVPDYYLLNKLKSKYGSRIVYRPFLEDDRYLVVTEKSDCNKKNNLRSSQPK